MNKKKIICLTPIKNESWILSHFLKSTSQWADHIILADQGSEDESREIAKKFPKVILIENKTKTYNESDRQRILITEARKIEGDKIFIALDADESLTSNCIDSKEWQTLQSLEPGTVIEFDWVNLLPKENVYWKTKQKMSFGFIDDGSNHTGKDIHSPRVPTSKNNRIHKLEEVKVMHFQYADWNRMESKHRWYQCWEHIKDPNRSTISIYRQYHHMYSINKRQLKTIPVEWLKHYKNKGIEYNNIPTKDFYYWDKEVIDMFNKYGLKFFSRIDVWNFDWKTAAKRYCPDEDFYYKDVQTNFEKNLIKLLMKTQPYINIRIFKLIDRIFQLFI